MYCCATTALVPLPVKKYPLLKVPAPVPPFATGNIPVTLLVKSTAPQDIVEPLDLSKVLADPGAKASGTPSLSPAHILPVAKLGKSLVLPMHETCILPEVPALYFTTIPMFCIK